MYSKKNEYINVHDYNNIYVKSNCILNSEYTYEYFNEFFKILVFSDSILEKLSMYPHKHMLSDMIGMHIRMQGGKHHQEVQADKSSNWHESEIDEMYRYRDLSHIDNFIYYMKFHLEFNPTQKFYIATDSEENYTLLLSIFGPETIYQYKRNRYDRSEPEIIASIIDILHLSQCSIFYGSYWSSFSEIVTYFQDSEKQFRNIFSNEFLTHELKKKL